MLHKRKLKPSLECGCGYEKRTATHIVKKRSDRLLQGGMKKLHRATIKSRILSFHHALFTSQHVLILSNYIYILFLYNVTLLHIIIYTHTS